jgi:hypothetical protein
MAQGALYAPPAAHKVRLLMLPFKIPAFLNVDLDIYSRSKLDALVAALGKAVHPLYVGRERREYSAHLELAGWTDDADATIQGLARLLRRLPRTEGKIWDRATRRDFNIGVQAAARCQPYIVEISARAVQMVSKLEGRILVTVYCPEYPRRAPGSGKKRRKS